MSYVSLHTDFKQGAFHFSARLDITSRVTGVFGPSGSGKTTFLHLLAGLQKPDKGFISINDSPCFDGSSGLFVKAHKRKTGYVFQEGRLFPHLNVKQNLQYGWKQHIHSLSYFNQIVELLELGSMLNMWPSQLSGGQKQRVAIGRALMSHATLLLLDEPFTALDHPLKKQVIGLLNKVIRQLDIPVIVVSHELRDLLMLTPHILLLKEGKPEVPATYLELIRNGKLAQFNGIINNYYNIFDGEVVKNDPEKGLTTVRITDANDIFLYIESDEYRFHEGDPVRILLRGADVALSLENVDNISIRNQLKGKVQTLYRHHNHLVVVIDCGVQIITRVTLGSGKSLQLGEGKTVWCLFKSLAIDAY